MPLPFLDPKKIAMSVVATKLKKRDLEVKPEVEAPESEMDPALKEAAEDLMRAINDKSVMDVAKALKAAYMVCESYEEPMEEAGE